MSRTLATTVRVRVEIEPDRDRRLFEGYYHSGRRNPQRAVDDALRAVRAWAHRTGRHWLEIEADITHTYDGMQLHSNEQRLSLHPVV